ncbi:MAG TPA: PAS domain-containing protein [Rhizomicrobium sp.]|jgi:hypothetical protein
MVAQNSVDVPLEKNDLRRILAQVDFSERCQQLADYWLSLCSDTALPQRDSIDPARIKALLPGIIIFEVVPDVSVRVGLSGMDFRGALKIELSGADWIARTPAKDRAERLKIFSQVARGAIAFNRWCFTHNVPGVGVAMCEKLLLPLRARTGIPAIPVLGFVDWNDTRQKSGCNISLEHIAPPELIGSSFAEQAS